MAKLSLITKAGSTATLVGLCALMAPLNINAAEPDGPDVLITLSDALEYQIISKIDETRGGNTDYDRKMAKDLKSFYLSRDRQPLWISKNGLTPAAKRAIAEIKNGEEYGMVVKDITFPSDELISGTAGERAEAEVRMSRAVLTYARYAKAGRLTPQKISRFLDNDPELPEPLNVMKTVSETKNIEKALISFHPKHKQFWALKEQLDLMRNATGSRRPVVKIPAVGDTIRPYDQHPDVVKLRQRLNVPVPERGGKPLYPRDHYDSALINAVKNFQANNGLRAHGVVNRSTRARFNKKKPNREKQLIANMERWRWMPSDFGDYHIRVNIPEFLVRVNRDGKVIHQERIIAGKKKNATPSFSDEMETIVFNPYWNVPQSIIWNEMGGVAPAGYESRYVNGRTYIRQPPGPRNALGRVKFLFPNKHSVYMHDTPNKSLFNKQVRAFSHGCMRLRDPLKMAEIILGSQGFSRKNINGRVASGRNQQIKLDSKVPVHVTYFTMWSNEDGSIKYFNDLYGHDIKVTAALEGRPMGLEPRQRINKRPRRPEYVEQKPKKYYDNYNPGGFIGLFFN